MGVTQLSSAQYENIVKLTQTDKLNNRRDVVHGGSLAMLLNSARARAAHTIEGGVELGGVIDFHAQFMQPASGTLTAKGSIDSATRTLAFVAAKYGITATSWSLQPSPPYE